MYVYMYICNTVSTCMYVLAYVGMHAYMNLSLYVSCIDKIN